MSAADHTDASGYSMEARQEPSDNVSTLVSANYTDASGDFAQTRQERVDYKRA